MTEHHSQHWYELGRKHAISGDRLIEPERDRVSASNPDDLAAYDAGYHGGPRPPLSAEDVIREISQKATAMLSRGETPEVLRIGHIQDDALRRDGLVGDKLTVPATRIGPGLFMLPGETNPSSQLGQVFLRVERTDDDSRLEVVGLT
jgi:hypothetical protein